MTNLIKDWSFIFIFSLLISCTLTYDTVREVIVNHSTTLVCIRNRLPKNSPLLWAECRISDYHMELGNKTIPENGEIKWKFPSSKNPHNFCLFRWDGKQQIIGVGGRETICNARGIEGSNMCLWVVKKDGLFFQTAHGLEKECDWQDLECLA